MITDIHTHRTDARDAIINVYPGQLLLPDRYYSVGIHPWESARLFDSGLLEESIADPRVVAVGETGLDSLCDVPLDRQEEVFRQHVALSEKYSKPVILHVVRRFDDILRLKKQLRPTQPWIVHGFRGKPALGRQLVDAGFYLSIGERFNPATLAALPEESLLLETDESTLPVADIASHANLPLRDFSPLFLPSTPSEK